MARVPITEYAAKRLVIGETYAGVSVTPASLETDMAALTQKKGANTTYTVKVDTGVKKRWKRGLVKIDLEADAVKKQVEAFFADGHGRCLIEPFVAHQPEEEKYVSINLVREGGALLHSEKGGVLIEDQSGSVTHHTLPLADMLAGTTHSITFPGVPLNELLTRMATYRFSFLEINPYLLKDDTFIALDMAVETDSEKTGALPTWAHEHIVAKHAASKEEEAVLAQNEATQASLNLHTLNPNGSILTLLSGGGASIVVMDSLVAAGLQEHIINYSEYSGAPTRDEVHVYANTLLDVLFQSPAKKKLILIAGGVANFTDVLGTFQGIVDAFRDNAVRLKEAGVFVCVRRGGPNQEAGLAYLRDFLTEKGITCDVRGPELSLGDVGALIKKQLI